MKSAGEIMKEIDGANYSKQYEILEKWQKDTKESQRGKCFHAWLNNTDGRPGQAILNAGKSPEGKEKEDE